MLCRTRVCPLYPPTPPTPPYTVYTARSHIASTHTARALRTLRRVPRLWPHGSGLRHHPHGHQLASDHASLGAGLREEHVVDEVGLL